MMLDRDVMLKPYSVYICSYERDIAMMWAPLLATWYASDAMCARAVVAVGLSGCNRAENDDL